MRVSQRSARFVALWLVATAPVAYAQSSGGGLPASSGTVIAQAGSPVPPPLPADDPASQLRRRADQERKLDEASPVRETPQPRREIQDVPGLKIDVQRFRVTGAESVPAAELEAVAQQFAEPGKSLQDLYDAAEEVRAHLQRLGLVIAQVYVPEQRIEGGVIELAVLEGRLGAVRQEWADDVRVSRGLIEGYLGGLVPGKPLRVDVLERALFLVNDLRGVNVYSILEPGKEVGTADLVLRVSALPRVEGSVDLDNFGSRFSGELRLGGSVTITSPFGIGDGLSLSALSSLNGGLRTGSLSYIAPLGATGARAGIGLSAVDYRLDKDDFPQDLRGDARVASVYALYPFARTRNLNLFGFAGYDHKSFSDRVVETDTDFGKRSNTFKIALTGDMRDGLGGGGITAFSIGAAFGRIDADDPAVRELVPESFRKLNLSVTRLQKLPAEGWLLLLRYAGQFAGTNLDVTERFSLGGAAGVRAYAQGESTADDAHLLSAELRYVLRSESIPGDLMLSAFYDWGSARVRADLTGEEPVGFRNRRTLSAVGLALTWTRPSEWAVRASMAWRTGDRPITDTDDRNPRVYVQATRNF